MHEGVLTVTSPLWDGPLTVRSRPSLSSGWVMAWLMDQLRAAPTLYGRRYIVRGYVVAHWTCYGRPCGCRPGAPIVADWRGDA